MTILLVSPGTGAGPGSGGGTAFFRGLAVVAGRIAPVIASSAFPADQQVSAPDAVETVEAVTAAQVARVVQRLRPRVVIKVSGALGGDDDRQVDLDLVRSHTSGVLRLVYVDGDAPSRLPILAYQPSCYLGALGAGDVPVVLLAGAERAHHQYQALGFREVLSAGPALADLGVRSLLGCDPRAACDCGVRATTRSVDLCSLLTPADPRSDREQRILAMAEQAGLTTVAAGRSSSVVTPRGWHAILSRSRMCLNLLREDVSGYGQVPSARIFEAAHAGSVIVSDDFPGFSGFVPAPFRRPIPEDPAGWRRLADAVGRDRPLLAPAARQHVEAAAERAAQAVEHLFAGLY
jgi:hypothetical protein